MKTGCTVGISLLSIAGCLFLFACCMYGAAKTSARRSHVAGVGGLTETLVYIAAGCCGGSILVVGAIFAAMSC